MDGRVNMPYKERAAVPPKEYKDVYSLLRRLIEIINSGLERPPIMDLGQDNPTLPPGVKPPLAGQSVSDHSGAVVVVTGLFLTIALASLGIKLYARTSRQTRVAPDDYTLILAWVQVRIIVCTIAFV